jgi:hypothetical protein
MAVQRFTASGGSIWTSGWRARSANFASGVKRNCGARAALRRWCFALRWRLPPSPKRERCRARDDRLVDSS